MDHFCYILTNNSPYRSVLCSGRTRWQTPRRRICRSSSRTCCSSPSCCSSHSSCWSTWLLSSILSFRLLAHPDSWPSSPLPKTRPFLFFNGTTENDFSLIYLCFIFFITASTKLFFFSKEFYPKSVFIVREISYGQFLFSSFLSVAWHGEALCQSDSFSRCPLVFISE